jgi:putative ABC transport system permease protein
MGTGEGERSLEIVGVAGETRQLSVFQPPAATLYTPIRLPRTRGFYVTMAAKGNPAAVLEPAREIVLGVDPTLDVDQTTTLDVLLRDGVRHIRLRMVLMTSLAALAGVLAMIGISGVVAHFLSEQTRDVGIRMALGAAARGEVGRVVRHALLPTVIGLGAGVAVAAAASGLMEGFLFGIATTDPITYVAVTAALLGSAALAAWIPARRAAAVDPARVLNREA